MENRVVALAVLENLIHWPLPHRSGYVAPNSTNFDDGGGEEDAYNSNTVSAGDADDLSKEPRQRKLDRYRAVLLLPHLCHKLGTRWVDSEVVPYLLRCLEEDDPQLSLVSGLALLGVTLPRRGSGGSSSPPAASAAASPTSLTNTASGEGKAPSASTPVNGSTSAATAAGNNSSSSSSSPTVVVSPNAYLSLDDVVPVCTLLAASGTEETRAFAAQVIFPHLYFGTALERDLTLESWDLKFVPLSVLHADMIASNSGGGVGGSSNSSSGGGGGGGSTAEDDGSPSAAAAAARAEEGGDAAATLGFIAAVRKQLLRQRYQEDLRLGLVQRGRGRGGWGGSGAGSRVSSEAVASPSSESMSANTSFPKLSARDAAAGSAVGSPHSALTPVTDDDVRRCCQRLVAEDEAMQFLFSGSYDTLTGPWGFSGCRLAALTQGAKALIALSPQSNNSSSFGPARGGGGGAGDSATTRSTSSRAGGESKSNGAGGHENRHDSNGTSGVTAMSAGGGFRSFRGHERRASGSQALRGAPPPSQRPLSEADLELYGASYAVDKTSEHNTIFSSNSGGGGGGGSSSGDDFFSVNVRARALVGDLTRWMEAITPATPAAAVVADLPASPADSLTSPASPTSPNSTGSAPSAATPLLFVPGQTITLYDYFAHEGRREVLRSRWRAQLKLLQSLLESSYPGPVAVAVELISGLLHAVQFVAREVEDFLQRGSSEGSKAAAASSSAEVHSANGIFSASAAGGGGSEKEDPEALLWGLGVPSTPLLSTAQLQSFMFRTTRRHIAYCVAAAVTVRKVNPPPSLFQPGPKTGPAASTAAAWRAPTDTLARLLRAALPVAQKHLTDLLLRHHLLVKLSLFPSSDADNVTGSECVLLQIGAGPCESRAAALSAWDVSFLPSSGQGGYCHMPDDTSFLVNTAAAAAAAAATTTTTETATTDTAALAAALDRSLWLPGTLNAFSIFRVHRIIRRALLRALPLAVDFLCLANPSAPHRTAASATSASATAAANSTATSSPSSSIFALCAVCPMLLQVLVPPGTLPALLRVLHAAATLPDEVVAQSSTTKSVHVDPAVDAATLAPLATALPALWAAMTAPGSILGTAESATAAVQGQETPSSLDFDLLEAALDAVQRLTAEAAVQLSFTVLPASTGAASTAKRAATSTAGAAAAATAASALQVQTVQAVCAQLFTLVAACVRWVPRYTSWKARWLIAQKLPRLVSTFCYLLSTVADLSAPVPAPAAGGEASKDRASALHSTASSTTLKPFQHVAVMWLQCTVQLLTSVWSCAEAFGVAPLNDLTDDEEVEVRCIAVRCAAFLFRRVTEAVLRLSAAIPISVARGAFSAGNTYADNNNDNNNFSSVLMLPSLTEPLVQLLDATAQCVLVGANDVDPRVRCRAAEALAVLSRTLSMLVAADSHTSAKQTSNNNSSNSGEAVWTRYLRSNTDALLRLMSDEKPTVQLALVSQLTDLLLMRMQHPNGLLNRSKNGSLMGSREELSDAAAAVQGDGEGQVPQRSADQVQHEALLQCLRQLAQHELWRLREQYAVLLAHLCGRLLQTAMIQPRKLTGRLLPAGGKTNQNGTLASATGAGAADAGARGVDGVDERRNASMPAEEASPYGHTHPLYQLARTELLTLLVAVLFDKVKAVRDTALDAVERMCLQLAAATRQSNNSLQQDAAVSSVLGNAAGGGSAVAGRAFESMVSSSSALQNAGSGTYNINTFVDNVLWPRISNYDKAWETYLSRSALLHIALRLRVDKSSVFIPLLDQLARDPVLNVRLVVAKIILEVLLRSSPDVYATPLLPPQSKDGEEDGGNSAEDSRFGSFKPDLPSGTIPYSILMNKPAPSFTNGGGSGLDAVLPPLQFTEEERTGVILQILRQLLKDASSDVRDEAAKALKVCF